MTKESKIFFVVLLGLIVGVLFLGFLRFIVTQNYAMILRLPCDPAAQSCFVSDCDPEEEECSEDPEEDRQYYFILSKMANRIPACDPHESEECAASFACSPDERECEETFCDPEAPQEGDRCGEPPQAQEPL